MAAPKIPLLLLSKEGPTAQRMVRHLRSSPYYDVSYEHLPKKALIRMETQKFKCLILNLDQFGFRQYRLIEQIRNLNYKFQILVFADEVIPSAEQVVEKLHDVIIFSKNQIELDEDLLGICTRFVTGEAAVKRAVKRKTTRQKALAENLRTNHHFYCTAYNMSEGGAYIEFTAGGVNINDIINVKISLVRLKKSYTLKARVMWLKTAFSGARAAGLKFIK